MEVTTQRQVEHGPAIGLQKVWRKLRENKKPSQLVSSMQERL